MPYDPCKTSDRAGVASWKAAEFSDNPVSPSDWGGLSMGCGLLLYLHESNSCFIVKITSALMAWAVMATRIVTQ